MQELRLSLEVSANPWMAIYRSRIAGDTTFTYVEKGSPAHLPQVWRDRLSGRASEPLLFIPMGGSFKRYMSLDKEPVAATVERLAAKGPVHGFVAYVRNSVPLEELFERSSQTLGGLDNLISNAGGPPAGDLEDLSEVWWDLAHGLTLQSVVRSTRLALRLCSSGAEVECSPPQARASKGRYPSCSCPMPSDQQCKACASHCRFN